MIGRNSELSEQVKALKKVLQYNQTLCRVAEESEKLGLTNYYLGAGCIAQSVWNYQNGNPTLHGIDDIDFVYYDDDLSLEAENSVVEAVKKRFSDCPLRIDVKNQARVHIWYWSHFGYDIAPYNSLESAINTWPTTATAIGIRQVNGQLKVYAPYGLNDLFSQIVRPNKLQITQEIYEKKVNKWLRNWPSLTIVPW